jgi:hypothetical protein
MNFRVIRIECKVGHAAGSQGWSDGSQGNARERVFVGWCGGGQGKNNQGEKRGQQSDLQHVWFQ